MESNAYVPLGEDWKDDKKIACCTSDPGGDPTGCDCCYEKWVIELQEVKRKYQSINEQSIQFNEQYKFAVILRDKFKSWIDDLDKTDELIKTVCSQFDVLGTQATKVCTNSEKTVDAIVILFCMIRDLFEQIDLIVTTYNQIDNCIKCLNSDQLPEDSGIRKCLKLYMEKVDAVVKIRYDIIKAVMNAIKLSTILHEEICSDYGLVEIIKEWQLILNCAGTATAATATDSCPLDPILSLPVTNDAHYKWVKTQYAVEVTNAAGFLTSLTEANKKKEAYAACQASLVAAIKEADPKELCK